MKELSQECWSTFNEVIRNKYGNIQNWAKKVWGVLLPYGIGDYYDDIEHVWYIDKDNDTDDVRYKSRKKIVCPARQVPATRDLIEFLDKTGQRRYEFRTKKACILNFVYQNTYVTTKELLGFIHMLSDNGRYNRATRGYYCTWLYGTSAGGALCSHPATKAGSNRPTSTWSLTTRGINNMVSNRKDRDLAKLDSFLLTWKFPEFKYHGEADEPKPEVVINSGIATRVKELTKENGDLEAEVARLNNLLRASTDASENILKKNEKLKEELSVTVCEKEKCEERIDELEDNCSRLTFQLKSANELRRVMKSFLG